MGAPCVGPIRVPLRRQSVFRSCSCRLNHACERMGRVAGNKIPVHPAICSRMQVLNKGNGVSTSPKTTPKSIYQLAFWCFDLAVKRR